MFKTGKVLESDEIPNDTLKLVTKVWPELLGIIPLHPIASHCIHRAIKKKIHACAHTHTHSTSLIKEN